MLNKLKIIGVLLISILLLTNCTKDNKKIASQSPGEISFAAIDALTEKDGITIFDIECLDPVVYPAVKAKVVLKNEADEISTHTPEIYWIEGKLYTQSLKLLPGDYRIMEFSLLTEDDVKVKSVPMEGSDYADFVSNPIDNVVDFTIVEFLKSELSIEVLCYVEAQYDNFGFEWFEVVEMTIREQCFFGDFCIKDPSQYLNSYYNDDGDVTIDEKAIFMIKVLKYNFDLDVYEAVESFKNYDEVAGVYMDAPLCVEYKDYDATVDKYKFELWIYVTSGDWYDYVYFDEWVFEDDEKIEDLIGITSDGVVDFVLGNCVTTPTDLLLPPWMNLPTGADFTLSLAHPGVDSYWDMTVGGISSSLYDMQNGTFDGWCADEGTTINPGSQGCMNALSSLYPDDLPLYWLNGNPAGMDRKEAICAANWLWNQLEAGYYPNADQDEIQNALWNLFNNLDVGSSGDAYEMANAAKQHIDFSPLPGGWAAIFFAPCIGEPDMTLQMTFFVVDP